MADVPDINDWLFADLPAMYKGVSRAEAFCVGWAYEPCGKLTRFLVTEQHDDGYWLRSPMCREHVVKMLIGWESLRQKPRMLTLVAWPL